MSNRFTNAEYDEFMELYKLEHKCCPKCGSEKHMTTLMAFALNMDDKESYKNLNRCTCMDCNDVHSAHDRVKKQLT